MEFDCCFDVVVFECVIVVFDYEFVCGLLMFASVLWALWLLGLGWLFELLMVTCGLVCSVCICFGWVVTFCYVFDAWVNSSMLRY